MSRERPVRAEVLAIGDEMTHGACVDTNSAWIARVLESHGASVERFTVVGDAPDELVRAIAEVCARADFVVATGGLGPTVDDRTRDAAAAAVGESLRFDEAAWGQIESWFQRRGRAFPASNRRQAWLPASARVLENHWGTAPGFELRVARAWFYALPGVPSEMREMVGRWVVPALHERFPVLRPVAEHRMCVVGLSEADLGERIADHMAADRDVVVGITAHFGVLTVRIVASAASEDQARAQCRAVADELRPRIGETLVFEGDESLAARAARALLDRDLTIAVAESCSGGLLASRWIDVPGISRVFRAGFVTYADDAKVRDLGVPEALIAEHGAVSVPVAEAMAKGAAARTGARLGVAITGIAGPDGGSDDKPVGTVCFALALDGEVDGWRARIPPIGREFVRERAVAEVFAAVVRRLDPVRSPPLR